MNKEETNSLHIISNRVSDVLYEDTNLVELKIYGFQMDLKEKISVKTFCDTLNDDIEIANFIVACKKMKNANSIIQEYRIQERSDIFVQNKNRNLLFEKEVAKAIIEKKELAIAITNTIEKFEKIYVSEYNNSKWDKALKNLNPKIANLKNLISLDLSCNCLNDLPETLTQLKNLKSINLSNNLFTEIPAVLYKMENLEYINFESNPISEKWEDNPLVIRLENLLFEINQKKINAVKEQSFEYAAHYRDVENLTGFFISQDFYFDYYTLLKKLTLLEV